MPLSAVDEALGHAESHVGEVTSRLAELVRIPSISAEASRPRSAGRPSGRGSDARGRARDVRLLEVPGQHPYVIGDWLHAADAPTLLVYGHHDVQPPGRRRGVRRLSSRRSATATAGVGGRQGRLVAHVAAARAWLETAGGLPFNVKVMVEGEEEIGSPGLEPFLARYGRLLAADESAGRRGNFAWATRPSPIAPRRLQVDVGPLLASPSTRLLGRPGPRRRAVLARLLADLESPTGP